VRANARTQPPSARDGGTTTGSHAAIDPPIADAGRIAGLTALLGQPAAGLEPPEPATAECNYQVSAIGNPPRRSEARRCQPARTNRQETDVGKRVTRIKHRVSPGTVLGTIALLVALSGAAYAAIPGSDGTIKGCYATTDGLLLGIPHSKGDLRAIDSAASCRAYEKLLTWNQQGRQGDPGPQGLKGDPGPQGLKGDAGPPGSSFSSVVVRSVNMGGRGQESGTASCNAGEFATGGGFFAGGWGAVNVLNSHPTPPVDGAQPTAWTVDVTQETGAQIAGRVYAVCAAP
jgi:hypothetical protein